MVKKKNMKVKKVEVKKPKNKFLGFFKSLIGK